MGGGLKGVNQDEIKYDTIMNIFKGPTSLDEAWNLAGVITVASDNAVSE